jgi:peptide/nickel transport system substrate-binding protein
VQRSVYFIHHKNMRRFEMSRKIFTIVSLLVIASMALTACGGTTPAATAAPAATEAPADPAVTEVPAENLADTIIIGTWQQPRTFYTSANNQAITVEIQLVYRPRFVLHNDFTYRPNPNLVDGDLPTLENGGAVLNDVTVKAGEPIFSLETYMVEPAAADTQTKQLVVTGKIKADLKWSDGQPLTTHDMVLAWQKNCESIESRAIDVTYCPYGSIEGASGLFTSYEAPDDTTIVATYVPGALDPVYFVNVFDPNDGYGIQPSHLFKDVPVAELVADERATGGDNAVPLGFGAYKMVEWVKGDHITFAPNEYWTGEKPKTPNIIYRFFSDSTAVASAIIAGEIDATAGGGTGLAVDQAPYMMSVAKRGIINYSVDKNAASFEMLYINYYDPTDTTFKTPHPVLSEFCVRKAIALGLNRQQMVDTIYYGDTSVVQQPQLPQMVSYDESLGIIAYDVEQAKKTLEDCGWVDSDGDGIREKNGVKAAFNYVTTSGNAPRQTSSQVIQASLKDIGMEVTLNYQPSSVTFSKDVLYGRNFNTIQFANNFSVVDPGAWLFGVANCGQIPMPANGFVGGNYAGWCYKPASDASVDAAYLTLDKDKRLADWKIVIEAYFNENDPADFNAGGYPVIPLFARPSYNATDPGLSGLTLNSTEYFTWNIETWTLTASE